jgi:hypothetical protein
MSSGAFAAGVNDVRGRKPARFDGGFADDWGYERGRQWALIAPRSMPLRIRGKLNIEAMMLFERAWLAKEIV